MGTWAACRPFSAEEVAMRLQALCLVTVFGLLVSTSAGQDKTGAGDKDKLKGTWTVASGTKGGKDVPEAMFKEVKFTFAGDKMTIAMGKDLKMEWGYKIDPTKKPKEIDVTMPDGKTGTGIYELSGDTLKIAHGEVGDARPKDFVSKEGGNVSVMVLKREKAEKK
jgi:uncharacterized protein (TIGR03067 family)